MNLKSKALLTFGMFMATAGALTAHAQSLGPSNANAPVKVENGQVSLNALKGYEYVETKSEGMIDPNPNAKCDCKGFQFGIDVTNKKVYASREAMQVALEGDSLMRLPAESLDNIQIRKARAINTQLIKLESIAQKNANTIGYHVDKQGMPLDENKAKPAKSDEIVYLVMPKTTSDQGSVFIGPRTLAFSKIASASPTAPVLKN